MLSRWWLHICFQLFTRKPGRDDPILLCCSAGLLQTKSFVCLVQGSKSRNYTPNFFETNRWTKPTGRQNKVTPERHSVWRNAGANGRFRDEQPLGDLKCIKIHNSYCTPQGFEWNVSIFVAVRTKGPSLQSFFWFFAVARCINFTARRGMNAIRPSVMGTSHWQFQTRFFIHHHVPSVFWGFLKGWKFSLIFFVYHIRSVVGWVNWPDTLTGCFFWFDRTCRQLAHAASSF